MDACDSLGLFEIKSYAANRMFGVVTPRWLIHNHTSIPRVSIRCIQYPHWTTEEEHPHIFFLGFFLHHSQRIIGEWSKAELYACYYWLCGKPTGVNHPLKTPRAFKWLNDQTIKNFIYSADIIGQLQLHTIIFWPAPIHRSQRTGPTTTTTRIAILIDSIK